MKMKLIDRILLTLLTLFIMLFSLCLLGIALNIIPVAGITVLFSRANYGMNALILSAIAVILFIVCLRLLISGYARKKTLSTIINTTELGVIRVSITTLDTLTQKAVRSFQEVKEVKSFVLPDPEGTRLQLKLTVLPDVPMPELSMNIQNKVKEYVESLSGITVKEVQIYIENLSIAKPVRVE